MILEFISVAAFIIGGFFILTSALGIMRMPDFYTRLHPAGMNDSLGIVLVLVGLLCHIEIGLVSFKIVLLIVFSLITSSTACHALAKAALISGRRPLGKVEPKPHSSKGKK